MIEVVVTLAVVLAALWAWPRVAGFRAQRIEEFRGTVPAMDLKQALSGKILCEGMIYGPFGRVNSRFVAHMEGRWQGNRGVLTEHFLYDSGAVRLAYRLRLPEQAGGHVLDVTDWLVLAPNGTIINRSQFTKWGIKVAELVATMRRVPA